MASCIIFSNMFRYDSASGDFSANATDLYKAGYDFLSMLCLDQSSGYYSLHSDIPSEHASGKPFRGFVLLSSKTGNWRTFELRGFIQRNESILYWKFSSITYEPWLRNMTDASSAASTDINRNYQVTIYNK